ncbi:hypothetical protein LINPERHAP1_LOCUS17804 [Linum perenne]
MKKEKTTKTLQNSLPKLLAGSSFFPQTKHLLIGGFNTGRHFHVNFSSCHYRRFSIQPFTGQIKKCDSEIAAICRSQRTISRRSSGQDD